MSRRSVSMVLDVFFVLLGALLGIATNYATNATGAPYGLRLLQRWSLPLVGISLVLLLCGRIWLHFIERPPKHAWTSTRPPFPGLEAFTELDAGVFFGRDAETEQLLDRLQPTSPRQARRFVSVIGPSGVGKSSLVQAGLLPRLAQRRKRWVIVPSMVPESRPIHNLARVLGTLLPDRDVDWLSADLTTDAANLARYIDDVRSATGHRLASVLIIVDQAEELLTVAGEQEGYAFLRLLRGTLLRDSGLWVVATLRSEFLTNFLQVGFADLFYNPVTVGTLDREALHEVIERPATRAGLTIPPGVVSAAVNDTGSGDALPLLAYTLQALYLRVGSGGTITFDEYKQLGGVAGTLAKQADKVTAELQADMTSVDVVGTLLKFVTVDGTAPSRRRVKRSSLDPGERAVVDMFIQARLLTSDSTDDDASIQVAHEALFRQWTPLWQAIEARAEDLRQRTQLERLADDWVYSGRRDSYLLRGERLSSAQKWSAEHHALALELPLVHEFLSLSTRSDDAALERLSEAIARRALACVDQDPEQSILLALAAIEECALTSLAQRALLTALASSRVRMLFRGHEDVVRAVAWSPDNKFIVTGSHDGTARIWDAGSGAELNALHGHTDWIRDVAWSPDGRSIATASSDWTARIWDPEHGTVVAVLRGHHNVLHTVAWSPDCRYLATGSHDGTARKWNIDDSTEITVFRGHTEYVRSVAWSPDGQRLATASSDGTARLWNAADGTEQAVLRGHTEWIQGVDWSPDGRYIATASRDRTARIWNAEDGSMIVVLRGHTEWVHDVDWSPDGQHIATASHDHTARIWDSEDSATVTVFRGHATWIQGVDWSPDGKLIATASHDRTTRIWRAADGETVAVLDGHDNWVHDVAWSPDGRFVATSSRDRTARVWDIVHGTPVTILTGHQDWIEHLAWSPDGRRIATGSNDHTARIWDASSGMEHVELSGHADWVRGVSWSPDGTRVVTGSRDGTARIWDAEQGMQLAALRGHEDWIEEVAWSPDGRYIATASNDRTARIWDATTGMVRAVLHGHEDWVSCVAWSPDGRRIATASCDNTARIWDAQDGIELWVLCVHEGSVEDVAWSPDGKRAVTVSRDHSARVLNANTDLKSLLATAHKRVLRKLTLEERVSAMLTAEPVEIQADTMHIANTA